VSLAVQELENLSSIDAETIDAFMEGRTFPIVEKGSITFVYRGEAEEVVLQHFIFGLPTSQPFHRLKGTDFWYLTVDVPRKSRIEYKIGLSERGRRRLIRDPLNPNEARDPFGANSVCASEGYETPAWTKNDPEARAGSIDELVLGSDVFGEPRPIQVYLPARFRRGRKYPLLVVHDGAEYMRYAELKTVLDNLIHRLEIPSLIAVMTESPRRLEEYAANETHARFIVEELVPMIEERFPTYRKPEYRGMMGASFGAVATLHAAWKYPGFFSRLLLQSGSFAFTDIGRHEKGPAFDPVVDFVNEFRKNPGRPAEKIFVTCGIYESLIYENRSLVPLLQATPMSIRYAESRDGHTWDNWRDGLRESLSWLFPGPLWMVYE